MKESVLWPFSCESSCSLGDISQPNEKHLIYCHYWLCVLWLEPQQCRSNGLVWHHKQGQDLGHQTWNSLSIHINPKAIMWRLELHRASHKSSSVMSNCHCLGSHNQVATRLKAGLSCFLMAVVTLPLWNYLKRWWRG